MINYFNRALIAILTHILCCDTGVGGNEWWDVLTQTQAFRTSAEVTLHVADDADGQTWTRPSEIVKCT